MPALPADFTGFRTPVAEYPDDVISAYQHRANFAFGPAYLVLIENLFQFFRAVHAQGGKPIPRLIIPDEKWKTQLVYIKKRGLLSRTTNFGGVPSVPALENDPAPGRFDFQGEAFRVGQLAGFDQVPIGSGGALR